MAKTKQKIKAPGLLKPHDPTPTVNDTKRKPSVSQAKTTKGTANGSSPAVPQWYDWTTELVSQFLNDYKFPAAHKAFRKERKAREKALGPHKVSEVTWPKALPELPFLVNLWVSGQLGAPLVHDAAGHDKNHDGLRDETHEDDEGSSMEDHGSEPATVPTSRASNPGQPDTAAIVSTSGSPESTADSDSEQSPADGQTLQGEVNGKRSVRFATSAVRKDAASMPMATPRDELADSSESEGDAVANKRASSSAASSSDDASSEDEKESPAANKKGLHAKPSASPRKRRKSKAKDAVIDGPSFAESGADPPAPVSGHDAPATTPKKRKRPHSPRSNGAEEGPKKARHSSGGADQAARSSGKAQNNRPFQRVAADEPVDEKFQSNAYVPYDYADRAHRDLAPTKGKNFTKEKNKKKRGSYRGGIIDVHGKKGIKFD